MPKRKTIINETEDTKNLKLANAIGKYTLLRLEWKDWKKIQPKSGDPIFVIVKTEDGGYMPLIAEYFDMTIPASKDNILPKSQWRIVKFQSRAVADLFLDNKDHAKHLVAWARPQQFGVVLRDFCAVCNHTPCVC